MELGVLISIVIAIYTVLGWLAVKAPHFYSRYVLPITAVSAVLAFLGICIWLQAVNSTFERVLPFISGQEAKENAFNAIKLITPSFIWASIFLLITIVFLVCLVELPNWINYGKKEASENLSKSTEKSKG